MPKEKEIRQLDKDGKLLNHLFRVRKNKIVEIIAIHKNSTGKIAYLSGTNQETGRGISIKLPCQKLILVIPKQIHPLDINIPDPKVEMIFRLNGVEIKKVKVGRRIQININ